MSSAGPRTKRPIKAEDLFLITLVSDPQASPDGSSIAWVQTVLDKEKDTYRSAIWVSRSEGSDARQLTSGSHRDSAPRWSPDGSTIAFVSNRPGVITNGLTKDAGKEEKDEPSVPRKPAETDKSKLDKRQVWTIRIDGGEAEQLTQHPNGASDQDWSPTGDALAFVADDDPRDDDGYDTPSTNGVIADERIVRDIHFRGDGKGFIERFSHIWRVDRDDKHAEQLTSGDAHDSSPHWSPDGSKIVFVSNRSEDRRQHWTRSSIYVLDIATRSVTSVAPEDADFDSPQWSPSGGRIAFLGHLDAGVGGSRNNNLWSVLADSTELTNHTSDWDISIGDFGMSDVHAGSDGAFRWLDNARMLALVSERGETQIYQADLTADGSDRRKLTNGTHRISGFATANGRLFMALGRIDAPVELYTRSTEGGDLRQFTHANATLLGDIELAPGLEIEAQSADGLTIQAWILKPLGFAEGSSARHPLILQIHGGPHAMYGHAMFHEMQLMAAKGYAVLFSNPRGSAGYGECFTGCTQGRWGESDMPDIIAVLERALAMDWIDADRLGITGGSYGGYLTNWIIGHDNRFRAAVTQRCVSNFHSFFGTSDIGSTFGRFEFNGLPWSDSATLLKYSPISYVERIDTPLLIIHNELDYRCPIEQAEQMFTALKYLGKDVGFVRIPEEGHDLSRTGTPSRRLARLHHLVGWFDAHI